MTLYQFDWQHRAPWDRNPSGWYYWTNTFFALCDTDLDAQNLNGSIDEWLQLVHRVTTQQDWTRIGRDMPSTVWITDQATGHTGGLFGAPGEVGILGQCCYVRGYIGDRVVAYKRIRTPLMPDETDGNLIESSTLGFLSLVTTGYLNPLPLCTRTGSLIERWDVRPRVLPWQVRHGTKRRERGVIGIPY